MTTQYRDLTASRSHVPSTACDRTARGPGPAGAGDRDRHGDRRGPDSEARDHWQADPAVPLTVDAGQVDTQAGKPEFKFIVMIAARASSLITVTDDDPTRSSDGDSDDHRMALAVTLPG